MSGSLGRIYSVVSLACIFLLLFAPCFVLKADSKEKLRGFGVISPDSDERIRVIVELNLEERPGDEFSEKKLFYQANSIYMSQDIILAHMSDYDPGNIIRYQTVPFLALEILSSGLDLLAGMDQVKTIRPDSMLEARMNQVGITTGALFSHQTGFTGKGWHIAVLDTGVDKEHVFLRGKVDPHLEICILNDLGCPNGNDIQLGSGAAKDHDGHGTHVAGIAAGNAYTIDGVTGTILSGTAPDSRLLPMRLIDSQNRGWISEVAAGLEIAIFINDVGLARIASINLSIGNFSYYEDYCDPDYPLLASIINNLYNKNIPVTTSAGNERQGVPGGYFYQGDPTRGLPAPACIRNTVAVGASDANDFIAGYSNHNHMIDVIAPGSGILSADYRRNNSFVSWSGTSMAAPQVAGAFALMKSAMPSATVDQMLRALKNTGELISEDAAGNVLTPKPRIRTNLAVKEIRELQAQKAECIFDGMEMEFSDYLMPAGPFTHDVSDYIYRCYEDTQACLAVYSGEEKEFFDQLIYVGPLSENDLVSVISVSNASDYFSCSIN